MNLKKRFLEVLPLLILAAILGFGFLKARAPLDFLLRYIPIVMMLTLVIIVVSFSLNLGWIAKQFSSIKKTYWILLVLIVISGFALRAYVAPSTHRLYFDEDIYLNIAQNIVNDGRSILCNRGTPSQCYEGELNKQPHGLPVVISAVFFLFGVSEKAASLFMIFASTFSIVLIFLVAYLIFKNEIIALLSALFLSLSPMSIFFAPTITGEQLFVAFSLLTFFALFLYLKEKNALNLLFFFSSLAFTVQIRPEAPLLAVPAALLLLKEKIDKRFLVAVALFFLLISPYLLHSAYFRNQSWGNKEGSKLDLKYVKDNFKVNGSFFFDNDRFPALFSVFSILGAFYLFRKKKILISLSLIGWFALFFITYLMFYAGSFNYGIDVRFSQTLFVPIFILAGVGSCLIIKIINRAVKNISASACLLTAVIIISFLPFIDLVSAVGEEAIQSRTDHDFALLSTKSLGNSCTIFSHVPSMFLVNGNNALQPSYYLNSGVVDSVFADSDCILFHEGYWCMDYQPHRDSVCKNFKDAFDLSIFKRTSLRDKNYTIYYVAKK